MAATRYCGDVRITMRIDERDREGWLYHCTVTSPSCHCEPKCKPYRTDVRLPLAERSKLAEDNPAAFDQIAGAALSFAEHDKFCVMQHASLNEASLWCVSRKKPV